MRRLVWSSSERHAEAWPRAAAGSQLSTTECSCGAETRRAHTDRHAPPATCCFRPSKMPGARRETWKERRSCSGRHAAAAADAAWFIAGCGCRDAPPARTAPPSARSQSAREPIPDTSVTETSRPKKKKHDGGAGVAHCSESSRGAAAAQRARLARAYPLCLLSHALCPPVFASNDQRSSSSRR